MRKISAIIGILTLTVLCAGCSQDPFTVERQYYWAQREAKKIYKNPHAVPPNELARVVKIFNSFSRKYPKSNLAVDAEFTIARLYMVTEEFENARTQLKKILTTYARFEPICAEAVFLIGNSYELENKWESALAQYNKIMASYPITTRGFEIPMYITLHYKVKYQPDKMRDAARDAINHYSGLAARFVDKPTLAFRAESLVVECYALLKDWHNAAGTLSRMIDKYKKQTPMDSAMMNLAMIYSRQMNDNAMAKATLEKLISDYPKSRLIGSAKQALQKLSK